MNWPLVPLSEYIHSEEFAARIRSLAELLKRKYRSGNAEDAIWAVLVDALTHESGRLPHPLLDPGKFKSCEAWWGYFTAACRNRILQQFRIEHRHSTQELPDEVDGGHATPLEWLIQDEEETFENEAKKRLPHIIESLPTSKRDVLTLLQAGMTNAEIARKLDLSPSRVSQLVSEALNDVRKILGLPTQPKRDL